MKEKTKSKLIYNLYSFYDTLGYKFYKTQGSRFIQNNTPCLENGLASAIKFDCSKYPEGYSPYSFSVVPEHLASKHYPFFLDVDINKNYRRRADMIIMDCFQSRCVSRIDGLNGMYYAGAGMILDSNMNPLMIIFKNMYGSTKKFLFVISTRIFMNVDGLVEKYIIKNLIPFIIENKRINDCDHDAFMNFRISDEIDSMIETNVAPRNIEELNDAESILKDNAFEYVEFMGFVHDFQQ